MSSYLETADEASRAWRATADAQASERPPSACTAPPRPPCSGCGRVDWIVTVEVRPGARFCHRCGAARRRYEAALEDEIV